MTWLHVEAIHSLDDIGPDEWDQLCDGCGICCLYKVAKKDSLAVCLTRVACRYLDVENCTCSIYSQRHTYMPTCLQLTRENVPELDWLPETCAYRRIAENKPLPWWHHLRSGRHDLVHKLRISAGTIAIHEDKADMNNLAGYVTEKW